MWCMIISVELKAKALLVNAKYYEGKYFIFFEPYASKPWEDVETM